MRLTGRLAQRDRFEIASHHATGRHGKPRTHQDRGDQSALHGFAVDLALDQRDQNAGALAVANQNDSAAAIEMREIIVPRIENVVVGKFAINRDRLSGNRREVRRA